MKHLSVICIMFLSVLTGCDPPAEQQSIPEASPAPFTLPKTFYKKLKGTIGDIPVMMNLVKKDSVLTGTYYYAKIGILLNVHGKINPGGEFTLSEHYINAETGAMYKETGRFSGSFTNDSTLEGNWTNSDSKKTLPFTLSAATDELVSVTFENRHSENCRNAEKNRKQLRDDMETWDTTCTVLDVELIHVATQNPKASQKINQVILKSICSISGYTNATTIDDLMSSVNNIGEDEGYELGIYTNVVTDANAVLCIRVSQSGYSYGAAHPYGSGNFYNFDTRTGKQLLLSDIFLPDYKTKLDRIGEALFIKTNGEEDWDFEKGKFELNADFAITPGGLLFSFDQYEIGSYVMGAPEVFIPYKAIEELMNPESLAATLGKNEEKN